MVDQQPPILEGEPVQDKTAEDQTNFVNNAQTVRQRFEVYTSTLTSVSNGTAFTQPAAEDYADAMNAPGREEIDAKLEAIEAKMDGRVASIEGKIDGLLAALQAQSKIAEERDKTSDARVAAFDAKVATIDAKFSGQDAVLTEIRSDSKSLKFWLIGTGVAIVLGIAAFNATVLSNMVASFESGKNTATSIVQATDQLKQVQEDLGKTQQQLQVLLDRGKTVQDSPAPSSQAPK